MSKRHQFFASAFLVALLVPVGVGRSETISYADAVGALAQNCGADIKKHCKGVNLANNGVQNCLQKNQAKVSPICTETLASVVASIQQRQAAQASVAKTCRGDVARLCNGVKPGDAHILGCLLKATHVVTAKCNQAITDAGWR